MRYKPSRGRRSRPKALGEGIAAERLVTTSLRLRAGLRAWLERLAVPGRRSVSDVAQQLLEEAVRLQGCPSIYFADEVSGRTDKIMGTRPFPFLTRGQIASARNYALRFPEEIDERIAAASISPPDVRPGIRGW